MKRIVTIGGGTGTFVVLSGLKVYKDLELTAVVSQADDGGSTGRLRDAYGFLPPGDTRQALVALAEDGDVLRNLFAYRFTKGDVQGHTLGNLFLTALTDQCGSNAEGIKEASRILRIQGKVVPATEEPATLLATFASGVQVRGQHAMSEAGKDMGALITLDLAEPLKLTPEAFEAIVSADMIVLGPGCLYSSTIAALLPEGTKDAFQRSKARIVYVVNLFTKLGETHGFSAGDHVREVEKYIGRSVDSLLVHAGEFSQEVLSWYAEEGEEPVADDLIDDARVIRSNIASVSVVPPIPNDPMRRSLLRHDSSKVAKALYDVLR
ncbi:MAG: uridine diphosphate-N-acetylglucosamine-binding protein YvcK [Candidatus Pacebacteria bacterium]|nr:uridine diphosphate-N-acetylglucosamine-binding protein YvcK [Candidatus Paceibacterota bacterium]